MNRNSQTKPIIENSLKKQPLQLYFGLLENSKRNTSQTTQLKLIAQQKISLIPKKISSNVHKTAKITLETVKNFELQGNSLIKPSKKPSFSLNKYQEFEKTSEILLKKPKISTVNPKKPLETHKKTKFSAKENATPLRTREKPTSSQQKGAKPARNGVKPSQNKENSVKVIQFSELLELYEKDDCRNVNINEEVAVFLEKFSQGSLTLKDFDSFFSVDWFDLKSANNFEELIEKTGVFLLKTLQNYEKSGARLKEIKEFRRKIVGFLCNGVEEFMYFEGISQEIFANFIKLQSFCADCLDILLVFMQRNSKKLCFFSEEKKIFLLDLLVSACFSRELPSISDENFYKIAEISENLLKNNQIREYFFNSCEFFGRLSANCLTYSQNNANFLIKKSHLLEISLFLISMKHADFPAKVQREDYVLSLFIKLANSLKIQREFPAGIAFLMKKLRKIFTNLKLYEIQAISFEGLAANTEKLKQIKGFLRVELQRLLQKIAKLHIMSPFLDKNSSKQ